MSVVTVPRKSFRNASFFVVATILQVILLFVAAGPAYAANQLVSFQGRVLQAGSPVSGGSLTVTIWSNQTGGALLYSDNFQNAINDGFFDLMLGASSELNLTYGTFYYLDVSINGEDANWTSPSGGTVNRIQFQSQNGQIPPAQIQYNAINASHIQNDAVTSAKIGPSAVNSSHLGAGLALTGNASIDSPTLFIDSTSDRVGIGTASPGAKLDVNGTIAAKGGNAPTDGGFWMADMGGTLRPRITSDANNDTVLRPGSSGGEVQINNFENTQELVHFTNTGNVGIGTTSPSHKLTINGGGTPGVEGLHIDGSTSGASINISNNGATGGWLQLYNADGTSGSLRIRTGSSLTDSVIIGSDGNVSIGTAVSYGVLTVLRGTGPEDSLLALRHSAAGAGSAKSKTGRITMHGDAAYPSAAIEWHHNAYYNYGSDLSFWTTTTGNVLTERMRIDDSGRVGIGRTASTNKLEVEGDASKTTSGSWLANSDLRIKKDIGDIDNAVGTLSLVRPVRFRYTDEYKAQHPSIKDKYYYNFIAQEFRKVFPTEVTVTNDTLPNGEHILAIDPYVVTPYLVKAVQEQQKQIEQLKAENAELKAENSGIKARLAALEATRAG